MSQPGPKQRTYISTDEAIGIQRVFNLRKRRPLVDNFTPLSEVPRAWLEIAEPKIKRIRAIDPKGGCWIWQGALDADGHPVMSTRDHLTGKRGQRRVARWVAWFFYEFPEFVEVSHHCRNLTCVRPSHLEFEKGMADFRTAHLITELTPLQVSGVRPGIDDRSKSKRAQYTTTESAEIQSDAADTMDPEDTWISVKEAIKRLRIGRKAFYQYRQKGLIKRPLRRVARYPVYNLAYIDALASDMATYTGPDRARGRGYGWGA